MRAPPIPTKPCVKCGAPTNETQSVYGVMHMECFKSWPPKETRAPIEASGQWPKSLPRWTE